MSGRPKISTIILTLNEEDFIKEAIDSASFTDEIIVVDSESSDGTKEVAESSGAKVIVRKFDDFSSQKNFAIDQASHDWVVLLDADERLSDALEAEMIKVASNPGSSVGFYTYRKFYFLNKRIRFGGWQKDKVVRLFNRSACRYNGNLVHETISARGNLSHLKAKLDHYSYRSFEHYSAKLDQYATLQAKQLLQQGKGMHVFYIGLKPPFRFFVHYFLRLGFLDGWPGLILAYQHANGVFSRYVKLWQLLKKQNGESAVTD